ncbi:hypothetical protein CEUSTIGMA_g424.t1 [Chlamydomonas eustigma]|uniref:Serine hydrolase domain-containing protein n=1 Tax=Chlamydomonas eustigma TaxID=1157962 RepID=A0A250WQY8_9CHLO|nr:hypothetical protein CEUSTIGMA_g424.t1 [Chlamydomonas eustigma]|eukprot:GAX72970.1 hypothetical protein CEUSTIGMA_g424.t1 [Chlamydomonas eustigma]
MNSNSLYANSQEPGRKLRVLALHSFRTSSKIFQAQFIRAKLGLATEDLVEVVYIDAPHPASGLIPRDVEHFFKGPYYEWFTVETMGDKLQFDEDKLAASTHYISKALKEKGPFDGIVAFSQGACLASSLVAMQSHGVVMQDIPRLKFCILFGGFKSRHPVHKAFMATKIKVPSLHVIGDRDDIKEDCLELADAFESSITLSHPKGHVIPAFNAQHTAILRAFLATFLQPSLEDTSVTETIASKL